MGVSRGRDTALRRTVVLLRRQFAECATFSTTLSVARTGPDVDVLASAFSYQRQIRFLRWRIVQ